MKKKKSTFQRVTMIVVWIMIISMVGSVVLTAISSLGLLG
ncbi:MULTISPECIES: DUF4044 domain-containing protein [Pediococcus]|uniref:DUF4044 domain-containing protein n=1 Tax=Pediococcus parvulus TaxID=54062 RepID=A0AAP5TCZ6_9LACO|nr:MULTISPECIES: DUF4044 domain-containing protein [Pediococcus]MCT3027579.1 DUF4044 domain-containing protein [Pediococcus parvulus]MCT3028678.1 DUF4044 domain-containing protein [Pediococcus parvulus]MCT3031289.1 DUF4044 domain-containing protein [Pediococcus parvulus]MCT3034382.1 DUF4044 domain-containing protein [Pediococcus parvulus]MDN5574558.1 DUF4044 domain-containing protein [Pediococcus sp.]